MIKQMKTLVFNTTEKHVTLYEGIVKDKVIVRVQNTSTVKVAPEGFYEVFVKNSEFESAKPKVRIPINEVIMFIED
jgi:hypothetical protein